MTSSITISSSISQQRIKTDPVPVLRKSSWFDVRLAQEKVSAELKEILIPSMGYDIVREASVPVCDLDVEDCGRYFILAKKRQPDRLPL